MKTFSLDADQSVLVIAEIGVNHDGSVEQALQLVRAAARSGADAVKVQLFSAHRLMHPSADFAQYQRGARDATAADMLSRYELDDVAVRQVAQEAANLGLLFLATPFSPADLALIAALNLPAVKIASPDLVNKPLLRQAAELKRPLLVSTGAAAMDEVAVAVGWFEEWNVSFALLHCVSSYPVPRDQAHLGWISELRERFGVRVGFSDHTTEVTAGALAVACGATIIEKHLTLDCQAPGPDHAASFDVEQLTRYVEYIRAAEAMIGTGPKRVLDIEQDVRRVSRQSLVVARPVAAGKPVTRADLTVQRPGTGIPAAEVDRFIGRSAVRPLRPGEIVAWDMVA